MKNITISVPEDVYRVARVRAAERDSSVSALVAEFLRSLSEDDAEFARLEARQRELMKSVGKGFSASDRLSRDELYDRGIR